MVCIKALEALNLLQSVCMLTESRNVYDGFASHKWLGTAKLPGGKPTPVALPSDGTSDCRQRPSGNACIHCWVEK